MRDSLRTTVSQFSSSGGQSRARANNARAVEPAADLPGAERGNLYMLLEVTGTGGGHTALYRQMLNAAQTAFYEARGTLAAALIRAVRSAHFVLVRANDALPEANWRAGISLAALRGRELTVAQAGPALAVVSHSKTVDLFPAEVGLFGTPLGGPDRPGVELFQTTVEPGSILMLAQSNWVDHVAPETLAVVAASEDTALASDYLGQLAGDAELSALLVGFAGSAIPEVIDESAAAPEVQAPEARTPPEPSPTREVSPVASSPARSPVPSSGVESDAGGRKRSLFGRRKPTTAEVSAEETPQPAEATEPSKRSPWPLLLAVIVIPLLIAAVVLGMLWLRTRTTETKLRETLNGAATAITEAQGLPDEGAARLRLNSARDFLDNARAIRPDDAELAKLQTQYDEVMDRINHVTPLYGIVPLWNFKESGRHPARVLAGGDSLFVLDSGRQQIDRFILSQLGDSVTPADEPVVIHRAQQIDDLVVSDLVDMTWVEAAGDQRSRLLALDASGGLASYDVTWGVSKLSIVGREKWGLPQLIMGYSGNLYVVDTKANQIWRYRPSGNGYENPPEPYFASGTQVDLAGVQSIAIDGNIWLLFADGRLLKFFVGKQQAFELKGLPGGLSAPTAVVVSSEGDQIYIADAGNGRIVEFSKSGEFQRQFRPSEGDILGDMRSLYLDEAGSRFYILTADGLYKADLPRPATSPTPTPAQ